MEIRVALLPQLAGPVASAVCVVIDVLRATTVTATLFDRNCPVIYVAASHETARQFARSRSYVLCGETGGVRVPDFDFGNSPAEFALHDFTGRPVVLSTSNGTKAVAAVAGARTVLLGGAVNRRAVAEAAWSIARDEGLDIVLVCSGTDERFTLEDATVAGMYVENLVARAGAWEAPTIDDAAIAARRLWQGEPNVIRGWMEGIHAPRLSDLGFGEDVARSAELDVLTNVPVLVDEAAIAGVDSPVVLIPDGRDQ